jgi:hypothetical protein
MLAREAENIGLLLQLSHNDSRTKDFVLRRGDILGFLLRKPSLVIDVCFMEEQFPSF